MDRYKLYNKSMESFIFDSYSLDGTKTVLSFVYLAGTERFEEKIFLPKPITESVDKDLLNVLLFNLHLALGISYWKMKCLPKMEIESGVLSLEQAQFWNLIYTKGLGEFYYRNKIDFIRTQIYTQHSHTLVQNANTI